MIDHAIEEWIRRHQDWSDARLETTVHQMVPNYVDHKAARELLHRRRHAEESAEFLASERRHREAIEESQKSRRLDKWALSVAVIALLVGGAGLWRSFLPVEPAPVLPASPSLVPADHADLTPGSVSKPSKPATKPMLPQPIPSADEKPKALPTPPNEENEQDATFNGGQRSK